MKYAIIIPDGCADEPQESLGGKTPLQAARTPHMDAIAAAGVVGRADHVPPGYPPGSDVANLSLLGYDPREHFTGRAPLEAAAQGIELGPEDWAVRCNLVTIEDQIMKSFTAGQISSDEARGLLATLAARVHVVAEEDQERGAPPLPPLEFRPGVSYRNLLIVRGGAVPVPFAEDTRTTPPHDLTDKSVADDFPRGPGSDLLVRLMALSGEVFSDEPINQDRRHDGKPPATNVWLWGLGRAPALRPFAEQFGKSGVMITAVDLLRGLAELIGWRRREVEGATGYLDTDYAAKGRAAIETLSETDIVCVHIEAPDEASHEGDVHEKIKALEEIDRHIVGPLHAALAAQGDYRILITPDHPTPCRTKTHSRGPVPLAVCGTGITPDAATSYSEITAEASSLAFPEGHRMMPWFLGSST